MSFDAAALGLALAVPLAWLIDQRFDEPRNAFHPVAWFGTAMRPIGQWPRGRRALVAWPGGALAWFVVVAVAGAVAWWVQDALAVLLPWVAAPFLALLPKPSFA